MSATTEPEEEVHHRPLISVATAQGARHWAERFTAKAAVSLWFKVHSRKMALPAAALAEYSRDTLARRDRPKAEPSPRTIQQWLSGVRPSEAIRLPAPLLLGAETGRALRAAERFLWKSGQPMCR